jgi:NAD+ kinase
MRRFSIIGNNHEKTKQTFLDKGYIFDDKNPEFVISYGGDGTLLVSETMYPTIPKLFIKNTKVGKLAQKKENEVIIREFFFNNYRKKQVKKIEAIINGKERIIGATEVTLHNENPRSGVRYKVRIDNEDMHHELIGDGIIVCNTLGSTGYYKSITDSYFEVGIGLAFNNSTEQADHVVLGNQRHVHITITRGPGMVFGDNQERSITVHVGDTIEFFESEEVFTLIEVLESK